MAKFTLNPITGKLDLIGMTPTEVDAYLKLDQTTPQTIVDGLPIFEDGIRIGNSTTKFLLNGNDFELWVNGTKVQTWTIAVALSYLLLETGDILLLETGDKLILGA